MKDYLKYRVQHCHYGRFQTLPLDFRKRIAQFACLYSAVQNRRKHVSMAADLSSDSSLPQVLKRAADIFEEVSILIQEVLLMEQDYHQASIELFDADGFQLLPAQAEELLGYALEISDVQQRQRYESYIRSLLVLVNDVESAAVKLAQVQMEATDSRVFHEALSSLRRSVRDSRQQVKQSLNQLCESANPSINPL